MGFVAASARESRFIKAKANTAEEQAAIRDARFLSRPHPEV
jgi:hypothetical protein